MRSLPKLASVALPLLAITLCCAGSPSSDAGDDPDASADALAPDAEVVPPVFESPRFLTDEQGGVLILHGANVSGSAKSDPERVARIDPTDVTRLQGWGFDFARYLLLWDALEPEPGQIDQAYLDRIEERVDLLWSGGIHVMLDMHQDVYATKFCCDGAPAWAIRDDGIPFELQSDWFANYLQPAVKRAFDNFWAYDQGAHQDLQDHYAAAWAAVATRFRDHPGVLGYDVMNEPHPGSDLDVIELLGAKANPDGSHARFDRQKFTPFYQRVIDAIREVDAAKWVFVEPRYGAPGLGMPSYLDPLTDPRPGAPRIAYAPHLYSLKAEATGVYDPIADPAVAKWEHERQVELDRQPMPLLVGEWGFAHATVNAERYLSDVLEMADRNLAGWAWWSYDCGGWGLWECDGTERPMTTHVVRAYPRRIAGVPSRFSFDPATRELVLAYDDAPGVSGATEIVAPERLYPDGPVVTFTQGGEGTAAWDRAAGLLRVTLPSGIGAHEIRVRSATPAPSD